MKPRQLLQIPPSADAVTDLLLGGRTGTIRSTNGAVCRPNLLVGNILLQSIPTLHGLGGRVPGCRAECLGDRDPLIELDTAGGGMWASGVG